MTDILWYKTYFQINGLSPTRRQAIIYADAGMQGIA